MLPSQRASHSFAPISRELVPALVIVWSKAEPHRCGEIAFLGTHGSWWLGRGEDETEPLRFVRQRPGELREMPALVGESMSRQQLHIVASRDGIEIENEGRATLMVNNLRTRETRVGFGDIIELRSHYAFMLVGRPFEMAPAPLVHKSEREIGEPDEQGILGESVAAWELRELVAAAAKAKPHVLIHGQRGSGKELAARAIHSLSPRAFGPFVAKSAVKIVAAGVDAELFGNIKNYPRPGMVERQGLLAEANGGTLFIDDIDQLSVDGQAHLLRVLNAGGEYYRLGEGIPRRTDVRLVGATTREHPTLRPDLVAHFTVRVETPPLQARREDIPLLVRHLVISAAKDSPEVAARFVYNGPRRDEIHIDPALVANLAQRDYTSHVRELDTILWSVIAATMGPVLNVTRDIVGSSGTRSSLPPATRSASLSASQVKNALEQNRWSQTDAAGALGLSRHQMARLMKKHGLSK